MNVQEIRDDLKNIRYYFSRKVVFDKNLELVGQNVIAEKVAIYNRLICKATPRLYDLYVSLYLQNNTQESLSEKFGYSLEHISRLNTQLVNYFLKELKKEEKVNV